MKVTTQMFPHSSSLCHREDTNEADLEFEALLNYLKQFRGCDLTCYKRPSLMRRFQYRMQKLKIDSYPQYLQCLQSYPDEHLALLNDVFINFTGFYRDRHAWIYLTTEVIPKIVASQQPKETIRVWSAGCASGPEIYSLLILLAEIFGIEFCLQQVQCYATDVDADALQQAQNATYSDLEVISLPCQLLEKYFERTRKGHVLRPELRNVVVFEQHNLIQDAPLPDIDLLICRNVLMYFTQIAQEVILNGFHLSLKDTGILFLGQAEMLLNTRQLFTPISLKQRIYARQPKLELNDSCITPEASWL